MTLSEPGCYCGVVLSAMIARRLYLMDRPSLTFCNGLLLLYFTIDTVMGALETFFSFQLYKKRLILLRPAVNSTSRTPNLCTPHSFSLIDDEEGHINKCVVFLTIWTLWNPNRMLFHFGMVFARWDEDLCRLRRLFLFCSSGSCMSVMPPDF